MQFVELFEMRIAIGENSSVKNYPVSHGFINVNYIYLLCQPIQRDSEYTFIILKDTNVNSRFKPNASYCIKTKDVIKLLEGENKYLKEE